MKSQNYETFRIALATAVPLWMMRYESTPYDKLRERVREAALILDAKSEPLVAGGGKKGDIAEAFNATAEAVAILSRCPGGIRVFGLLFCNEHKVYGSEADFCQGCADKKVQQ